MSELEPQQHDDTLYESGEERIVIPVTAEQVEVKRQRVITGRVRVRKSVRRETVRIDEPGYAQRVDVQHVPINQWVDEAPPIRHEGDTMIIPVVQEVVVIERKLMLREEIHVTRHTVPVHQPVEVELRREEINVERFDEQVHPAVRTDAETLRHGDPHILE